MFIITIIPYNTACLTESHSGAKMIVSKRILMLNYKLLVMRCYTGEGVGLRWHKRGEVIITYQGYSLSLHLPHYCVLYAGTFLYVIH